MAKLVMPYLPPFESTASDLAGARWAEFGFLGAAPVGGCAWGLTPCLGIGILCMLVPGIGPFAVMWTTMPVGNTEYTMTQTARAATMTKAAILGETLEFT